MNNNFENSTNWSYYNNEETQENTNNCRFFDSDIYCGFQDINPELFSLMGSLVGIVMSDNMPFNVQNAIGNWITLIGQTIVTYNAQQQYFQNGPGRYYNPIYRNVGNPFCPNTSGSNSETGDNTSTTRQPQSNSNSNTNDILKRIENLEEEIKRLKKELNDSY